LNERLISKETELPCRRGRATLIFDIKRVAKVKFLPWGDGGAGVCALAHRQSSDEGLTLETSAWLSLHSRSLILSTSFEKNHLVYMYT